MKKTVSDEKRFIAIATVILVVISIVAFVSDDSSGGCVLYR